ncbi:MAG: hypothetical protein BWY69_00232 [Planctomycetes bacterium ADurb.Bin401]|nr:MAG: hypothetical protein BWY69_00232 [Planctomycetes bacterium ADurb.Bin401]
MADRKTARNPVFQIRLMLMFFRFVEGKCYIAVAAFERIPAARAKNKIAVAPAIEHQNHLLFSFYCISYSILKFLA